MPNSFPSPTVAIAKRGPRDDRIPFDRVPDHAETERTTRLSDAVFEDPFQDSPFMESSSIPKGPSNLVFRQSEFLARGAYPAEVGETSTDVGARAEPGASDRAPSVETDLRLSRPRVEPFAANHHLLNPLNTDLLKRLFAIVTSKANRSTFPISRYAVDIESDPDDETSVIALRVYTSASAAQTIAFWDSLEIELGNWLGNLTTIERRAIQNTIGLRFHWSL